MGHLPSNVRKEDIYKGLIEDRGCGSCQSRWEIVQMFRHQVLAREITEGVFDLIFLQAHDPAGLGEPDLVFLGAKQEVEDAALVGRATAEIVEL